MTAMRPYGQATLPARASVSGFVYVIEFSTRLVKVGSTVAPAKRLAEHRGNAAPFGITIERCWVSDAHGGYLDSEAKLIGLARSTATLTRKAQYFEGVDADYLVSGLLTWDDAPEAIADWSTAAQSGPAGRLYAGVLSLTTPAERAWGADETRDFDALRRRRFKVAA